MSKYLQKLNIVDERGNITGEDTRGNIHKQGLLHREIHVWFYTPNGEIIFQLRGGNKDTFPNLLDATVGGHVELGESFGDAALKEMEKETGVTAKISYLTLIETTRSNGTLDKATGNTNNAIRAVYAYKYVEPLENLQIEANKAGGFEA